MDQYCGKQDCQQHISSQKTDPTTIKLLTRFVWLHLPPIEIPSIESLCFLLDRAKANLADMGHSLEREMAMSQRDKELATETSQQAHYILWSRLMDIKDPCRADPAYKRIVGVYFRFLQYWVNYTNKDGLRAATLVGYAKAISTLFKLQGLPSPINLSDPDNATRMLITNHKKEEDIAVQQYPLN